jgi:DNA-binding beta-propeller fold protein YncE
MSRPSTVPALPDAAPLAGTKGPFLYVGGRRLSQYALNGSKPLHSVKMRWPTFALALDSFGNLFAANGNPSYGAVNAYEAQNLNLERTIYTIYPLALAVDRLGYLYVANCGDGIEVYAPGGTTLVSVIKRRVRSACALAFDSSGKLFVVNGGSVTMYAATKTPGRMKYVGRIAAGIRLPRVLAFAPSGNLFVANCRSCAHNLGRERDFVSVYAPGSSTLLYKITDGIWDPQAIAIDSTGRLYVASVPLTQKGRQPGWVSVYTPGGTKLLRKITRGIDEPWALAIDPSDRLS